MTHVAWAPPKWAEAARRTLAGLEERHPVADDPALPGAGTAGRHRRRRSTALLRAAGVVARGLLGGDRAAARRQARAGARLDRAAAPDLRPADVLPLARRAALGRAGARAARRRLRQARRRLLRVARAPAAYAQLGELFDRVAVSDIAWGRRRAGAGGSRRSGRGSASASGCRVTGPKAEALLLAGWLRSRLGRTSSSTTALGGGPRAGRSRRRAGGLRRSATAERERPALGGARPLRPRSDLRGRRSAQRADREHADSRRGSSSKRPPASSTITWTAAMSQHVHVRRRRRRPRPRRRACAARSRRTRARPTRCARPARRPGAVERVEERASSIRARGRRGRRAVREGALAARPPTSAGRAPAPRRRRDAVLLERDQRRPERDPAHVVPGAVDRVEDPARPVARRAVLLADHPVPGPLVLDPLSQRALDGAVGLGDRRQVGLRLDAEVRAPEPSERDRVGVVREREGEGELGGSERRLERAPGGEHERVVARAARRAGPTPADRPPPAPHGSASAGQPSALNGIREADQRLADVEIVDVRPSAARRTAASA